MNDSELYQAALAINDPQQRRDFLQAACGQDAQLLARLEALLQSQDANDRTEPYTPFLGDSKGSTVTYSCENKGTIIGGKYKLLQHLGIGGMGEVWVAEQTEPVHRLVAVKLIKTGMDSANISARFDQERQALAMMDHPNIAKILDGGTTDNGRPFFVMELVRGLSITRYCDLEKLSPRERLALFIPICQGVQHAHQKGIIHRDIKPSNILVGLYDGKPVPRIIDFGVAKATGHRISSKTVNTEAGSLLGTLEYMSPEQADLTNLDIDTRTDVYALGVILYELLTGTVPFTRKEFADAGLVQMLMMIKEKEPPKPSTRISTLQELPNIAAQRRSDPVTLQHLLEGELDWIIMKCLEKGRTHRYESPMSLANDLQRFLADEPVQAAPPSALYRVRKFVKRYRGQVIAAGVLLFMLIGSVIATSIGMWMAWKAEQKAQQAEALARSEADLHRALLLYLEQDLFGQFDPDIRRQVDIPLNKNITVRSLLDNASKLMSKRFENMPNKVQAALRRTLGIAFSSLGENVEAMSQLEAARKLIPRDDPFALDIDLALGILLHNVGSFPIDVSKLQTAENYLAYVVRIQEQKIGPRDQATMRSRYALGSLERTLGRTDVPKLTVAENRMTSLLQDQQQALQPNHPDIPRTMTLLADIHHLQKRDPSADKWYREALATCKKHLPPDHPQTLTVMNNHAHFLRTKGQYAAAMKLYQELIPAASTVYDRDEPLLLIMKNNQAVCYWHLGQVNEAEALYQEVLQAALRVTAPESKFVLELKRNIANIAFSQQDWDKAVKRYVEIVQGYRKEYGTDYVKTWELMENLAYSYFKTDKHDQSLTLSKELLNSLAEQKEQVDSKRYYRVLNTALKILVQSQQLEEAEQLVRVALQTVPEAAPEHAKVKTLLDNLLVVRKNKPS